MELDLSSLDGILSSSKTMLEELKTQSEKEEDDREIKSFVFAITDNQLFYYLREIEPDTFDRFLEWRECMKEEELEVIDGEEEK